MTISKGIKEKISALSDGELSDFETRRVLDEININPELREYWKKLQISKTAFKNESLAFETSDFCYNGPKPFNKETAILMMCDSVEAASKSLKDPNSTKINNFVDSIVSKQMDTEQFLNATINLKEIQSIKKVLKHKLANMYHLRIEYPE